MSLHCNAVKMLNSQAYEILEKRRMICLCTQPPELGLRRHVKRSRLVFEVDSSMHTAADLRGWRNLGHTSVIFAIGFRYVISEKKLILKNYSTNDICTNDDEQQWQNGSERLPYRYCTMRNFCGIRNRSGVASISTDIFRAVPIR